MKAITERERVTANNAWGKPITAFVQHFEVEGRDIGRLRLNQGGYGRPGHVFRGGDVGRTIVVYTDGTGWTNWIFDLPESKPC